MRDCAVPQFRVFNKKLASYKVTSGSHKHKFRHDMFYVEPGSPNFRIEPMARRQDVRGNWIFSGDIIIAKNHDDKDVLAVVFVSDREGIYADTGVDSYDLIDLHDIEIIENANLATRMLPVDLFNAIKAYRDEDHN